MKNEVKQTAEKKHSHEGHRDRMKTRIFQEGFDHLYDHELLEVLLFYGIPRRDTNELAHELIEHFGSLNALMEADVAHIAELPGMGKSAAILIKSVMEMTGRYVKNSVEPVYYYDTIQKVMVYLKNVYMGLIRETSYALLFDNKMKLLHAVDLGQGTVNASPIYLRRLVEEIVMKHASAVILAHNHPDGSVRPSYSDMAVTRQLYEFLNQMSVPLLEHIIVSGKEAYPIMHYSAQYDIEQLCNDSFGENFFHKFFTFDPRTLTVNPADSSQAENA